MNRQDSKNKPIGKILDSKPLRKFFVQSAFTTAFTCLTSGVFLSGLAILMGANDLLISYISVIVNICGVLILFFSGFLERFKSRKKLVIGLTILSRLSILFIVAIPALVPQKLQLVLFIPVIVIAFTLQAQTTVALNQWMLAFINEKKSGRYISLRQTLTLIITVIASITSGYLLDAMHGKYIAFVLLFAIAGFICLSEILLLFRIPDSEPYCSTSSSLKLIDIIKIPLADKRFISFVIYITIFYLLLYISDSFTTVYMMKYLNLKYQTVNLLFMIISLPQVFLLSIWGKISDKYGHSFVLKISIWLFAGETIFMAFATDNSWYIFIPIAFLIASTANAGFVISVFNHRYELIPEKNRIIYDNFYTATIGIGFIMGPMLGGLIKLGLESSIELTQSVSFGGIRGLYIISTIGILILQFVYLARNKIKVKNQ